VVSNLLLDLTEQRPHTSKAVFYLYRRQLWTNALSRLEELVAMTIPFRFPTMALLIGFVSMRLGGCFPVTSSGPTTLHASSSDPETILLTTAILRISYDGGRFTGWSAANDGNDKQYRQSASQQRRRRRGGNTVDTPLPKGFVRSVQGVIRDNLAKIYGDVDPRRVVVEGCSRTDKGVHAMGLIAQIYCLKQSVLEQLDSSSESGVIESSIPGKRLPHPKSPSDDTYFEPLPMNGNLSRLAFALNRMRPSDVQVTGIAPVPFPSDSTGPLPFHPTLSSRSKRYEYRISTGAFQDPTSKGQSWYVGDSLDISKMEQGCKILVGTHNFVAFRGVPRGPDERQKYKGDLERNGEANVCTLLRVELERLADPSPVYFPGVDPPIQTYRLVVQGDRFLYKMMRFLVGALVAVGTSKLETEDLEHALHAGNWELPGLPEHRRKEFQVAPAHGLILAHVDYDPFELDWRPLRY
jgi:tRNA pseudouridine38-40 synthase